MTTTSANAIQFRCNKCWQELIAPIEKENCEFECRYCSESLVVPVANESNLAEIPDMQLESALQPVESEEQPLSDADMHALVRAETNLPLSEMDFGGYHNASLMSRAFAYFLDGCLQAVGAVLGLFLLIALQGAGIVEVPNDPENAAYLFQICVVIFFPVLLCSILQWNLIATRGQSLGKMICCIRIIRSSGRLPGFLNGVILRNWVTILLASFIPFFGLVDILFIFSNSQRCLHDYIADTRVVTA